MALDAPANEQPAASGKVIDPERLASILSAAPRDDRGRPCLKDASFYGTKFTGDANFDKVVFDGAGGFAGAKFYGRASFAGAVFADTAFFSNVEFHSDASFDGASFGGTLWLNLATAYSSVSFRKAVLKRDATFDRSNFRGKLDFAEVEIEGDASFDMCVFESRASFEAATYNGGASYARVIAMGDFVLRGARFNRQAHFERGSYRAAVDTDGATFMRNDDLPGALEAQRRDEPINFVPRAMPDTPSIDDLLGFGPLVSALQLLLDDSNTELPLAIAITAPWGMGKSSVMSQLTERLNDPNRPGDSLRNWSTVDFPAWKYEESDRLWAALAKAIYSQPQESMRWWERLRFRLDLERRRLGLGRLALELGWPVLAAAVLVGVLTLIDISASATAVAALASVAALLSGLSRYWNAVGNPFSRAMDRYARTPSYKEASGFSAEADDDIACLGDVLCPGENDAVAVFVDDLDRCSHAHVVEVLEAMNQIFASKKHRPYVFVLGLDREMVSTNVKVAYRDTVEGLQYTNRIRARTFGTQFLAKMVQMSLALPKPSQEAMEKLLHPDTADEEGQSAEPSDAGDSNGKSEARRSKLDRSGYPDERPEGARLPLDGSYDSDAVREAEAAALVHLEANPRQIKRFHNAFRLQLHVASQDPAGRFDLTPDMVHGLAKWVALRLRWPELADWEDDDDNLVLALEAKANGHLEQTFSPEEIQRLTAKDTDGWFENPDVAQVLRERVEPRLISSLPRETFLHVA